MKLTTVVKSCWSRAKRGTGCPKRRPAHYGNGKIADFPNPHAFRGVASGNHIYCRYDDLSESYSGDSDSYRAVGIDAKKHTMVVYFYIG